MYPEYEQKFIGLQGRYILEEKNPSNNHSSPPPNSDEKESPEDDGKCLGL